MARIVAIFCAWCCCAIVSAQEQRLQFRREFVPQAAAAKAAEGLIPVPRTEFEELVRRLNQSKRDAPEVWIEEARYEAELDGDTLVGTGSWEIRKRRAEPMILHLGAPRIALERPLWVGEPSTRAIVGVDEHGKAALSAEREGRIEFRWSLKGALDPWRNAEFDLRFPAANSSSLRVKTDANRMVRCGEAIVRGDPADSENRLVELGGSVETRLTISSDDPPARSAAVLIRERSEYRVALDQIDVMLRWNLDLSRSPVRELDLEIPAHLAIDGLFRGETPLPYETISLREKRRRLRVSFEPPLAGKDREIMLRGSTVNSASGACSLPRGEWIDTHWLAGTAAVEIAPACETSEWSMTHCESRASNANELTFRLLSPAATIGFRNRPNHARRRLEYGHSLRFTDDAVIAKTVLDFTAGDAEEASWSADLRKPWFFESALAEPSDVLESALPSNAAGVTRLKLSWSRTLKPGERVRLILTARRPAPAEGETLEGDSLSPWKSFGRGAIGLASVSESNRGSRIGKHLARLRAIDVEELSPEEASRLDLEDSPLIVRDDDAWRYAAIGVRSEPARYRTQTIVRRSNDTNGGALWTAEIHATVDSAALDRMRIHVHPPLPPEAIWKLEADAPTGVSIEPSETPGVFDAKFERPLRGELTLRCEFPATADQFVPWFNCPEATSRRAALELPDQGDSQWVPAAGASLHPSAYGRAQRWSFETDQRVDLTLRKLGTGPANCGYVETCRLTTLVEPYLRRTQAKFTIAQGAQGTLEFRLPGSVRNVIAFTDENEAAISYDPIAKRGQIMLPQRRRAIACELRYEEVIATSRYAPSIVPVFPEFEVAPLQREWSVSIAGDYRSTTPARNARLLPHLAGPATALGSGGDSSSFTFTKADEIPITLMLIETRTLSMFAWLAGIACFVIALQGNWLRSPLPLIAATSALFLIPESFDPLARLIWLGTILGEFGALARSKRSIVVLPSAHTRLRPAALGACLAAFTASLALGQDRPAIMVERVVIPIDAEGNPVGRYVYLSERFFTSLHAAAEAEENAKPRVVFGRNVLRAVAEFETASEQSAWREISADWEFETFRAETSIEIPLSREAYVLDPEALRLNGRETSFAWNENGKAFTISVPTVGKHRLEFLAKPLGTSDRDRSRCNLPLRGGMETILTTIARNAEVRIAPPIGWGRGTISADGARGETHLGPLTRATLRCGSALGNAAITGEQLTWVHLYERFAVIEVQWKLASERPFEEAAISAPRSWLLLATAADAPNSVERESENDRERYRRRFPVPVKGTLLTASFLVPISELADDSWWKRIAVEGATLDRDWLAFDGAEDSIRPWTDTAPRARVAVREFADAWGAEQPPVLAWKRSEFSQRTAENTPTSVESYVATLKLDFHTERVAWNFSMQLDHGTNESRALRKIRIDRAWRPERFVWKTNANETQLTELPLAGGEYAVEIPADSAGEGTLEISGTATIPKRGKWTSALPIASDLRAASYRIIERRAGEILVDSEPIAGFSPIADAISMQPTADESVPLGERAIAEVPAVFAPKGTWNIAENRPEFTARSAVRPQREQAVWRCRWNLELNVTAGKLDAFRFELPDHWSPPTIDDESASVSAAPLPQGTLLITVRPQRPIGGVYRCELMSERITSRATVLIPAIKPLDCAASETFYLLKATSPGEETSWRTAGVQAAAVPEFAELSEGEECLMAIAEGASVESSPLETRSESLKITSLKLREFPTGEGIAVSAEFSILPGGRDSISLRLPEKSRLQCALIDQEPPLLESLDARNIRIILRHSELPQRLTCDYLVPRTHAHESPEISGVKPDAMFVLAAVDAAPDQRAASAEKLLAIEEAAIEAGLARGLDEEEITAWLAERTISPAAKLTLRNAFITRGLEEKIVEPSEGDWMEGEFHPPTESLANQASGTMLPLIRLPLAILAAALAGGVMIAFRRRLDLLRSPVWSGAITTLGAAIAALILEPAWIGVTLMFLSALLSLRTIGPGDSVRFTGRIAARD